MSRWPQLGSTNVPTGLRRIGSKDAKWSENAAQWAKTAEFRKSSAQFCPGFSNEEWDFGQALDSMMKKISTLDKNDPDHPAQQMHALIVAIRRQFETAETLANSITAEPVES